MTPFPWVLRFLPHHSVRQLEVWIISHCLGCFMSQVYAECFAMAIPTRSVSYMLLRCSHCLECDSEKSVNPDTSELVYAKSWKTVYIIVDSYYLLVTLLYLFGSDLKWSLLLECDMLLWQPLLGPLCGLWNLAIVTYLAAEMELYLFSNKPLM